MSYIESAIRDAKQAGYKGTKFFDDIADTVVLDLAQSAYFLDPAFWQALGRARGWNGERQDWEIATKWMPEWKYYWMCFTYHLADKKDAESFFKDL